MKTNNEKIQNKKKDKFIVFKNFKLTFSTQL